MIRLENVSKSYKIDEETTFFALKDATLEIKEKEFISIIGPSGSGKSTLMHLIGLLDKPSRGEIIIALFEELCESRLIQPTHIIDHPRESAPLARFHREDKNMVERLEPYINGWEVGNCYTELTDPILQKKLFEEQAKKLKEGDLEAHPMDEDYIRALEHGLPPNTGIGIGVDMMVMLLTDSKTIRDVILFPTMRPENK